jgi:DEAD/DEAH box helicase domain-containing protein
MFLVMFSGDLDKDSENAIRRYAQGEGISESPMHLKVFEAFKFEDEQLWSLNQNIQGIKDEIDELRKKPKDPTFDLMIKELRLEQKSISNAKREIKNKNTLNFLTDHGLLPNYAFPETGVVLRVILKRNLDDANKKKETIPYEFRRQSSSAISEFAPFNFFYVNGRKIKIDKVDLATTEVEYWRLCPNCSHAQKYVKGTDIKSCPRCGSSDWTDKGQLRTMLKVRTVYATNDYDSNLIADDADERQKKYYIRQMLVDIDEAHDI